MARHSGQPFQCLPPWRLDLSSETLRKLLGISGPNQLGIPCWVAWAVVQISEEVGRHCNLWELQS